MIRKYQYRKVTKRILQTLYSNDLNCIFVLKTAWDVWSGKHVSLPDQLNMPKAIMANVFVIVMKDKYINNSVQKERSQTSNVLKHFFPHVEQ